MLRVLRRRHGSVKIALRGVGMGGAVRGSAAVMAPRVRGWDEHAKVVFEARVGHMVHSGGPRRGHGGCAKGDARVAR